MREHHAVREMKEGPSKSICRGRLQTARSSFGQKPSGGTLWSKGVAFDHVMYGSERRAQANLRRSIEKPLDDTKTGAFTPFRDEHGRCPTYCPCGVRCVGGVTLIRALVRN